MTENTAPEPAISDNQAADLASLQSAAAAQESGSPVEPAPEAPRVELAGELAGLLSAVVGIIKPAFPTVASLYTPETIDTAAGAVAKVCNKHGWLQSGVMGEYSEEITALAILLPLGMATVNAVRADNAARAAEDKRKQPDAFGPSAPVPAVNAD